MSLINICWISVLVVMAAWLYLSGASMIGTVLGSMRKRTTARIKHLDDDSTYGATEGEGRKWWIE